MRRSAQFGALEGIVKQLIDLKQRIRRFRRNDAAFEPHLVCLDGIFDMWNRRYGTDWVNQASETT